MNDTYRVTYNSVDKLVNDVVSEANGTGVFVRVKTAPFTAPVPKPRDESPVYIEPVMVGDVIKDTKQLGQIIAETFPPKPVVYQLEDKKCRVLGVFETSGSAFKTATEFTSELSAAIRAKVGEDEIYKVVPVCDEQNDCYGVRVVRMKDTTHLKAYATMLRIPLARVRDFYRKSHLPEETKLDEKQQVLLAIDNKLTPESFAIRKIEFESEQQAKKPKQ